MKFFSQLTRKLIEDEITRDQRMIHEDVLEQLRTDAGATDVRCNQDG